MVYQKAVREFAEEVGSCDYSVDFVVDGHRYDQYAVVKEDLGYLHV